MVKEKHKLRQEGKIDDDVVTQFSKQSTYTVIAKVDDPLDASFDIKLGRGTLYLLCVGRIMSSLS